MMLVAVVGLFLLVELPLAIFLIVFICDNAFNDTSTLTSQIVHDVSLYINQFILLSYPLNFFIYCGMSRQFRETFRSLFMTLAPPATETEMTVNVRPEGGGEEVRGGGGGGGGRGVTGCKVTAVLLAGDVPQHVVHKTSSVKNVNGSTNGTNL